MSRWRVVLALAVWSVSVTIAGCSSPAPSRSFSGAARTATARPLVGALRFDVWQQGPVGNPFIGFLGPSQWRDRLPFYGTEVDSHAVALLANTQAIMDREIGYAHAAGLDFFAFNHFLTELRQSLNLYLSSTKKTDIKFCLQMGSLNADRVADAVNLIKTEPTYQTVAGGRALVFMQTWAFANETPPPTKADVDNFRTRVMQAGLPNPYIVAQNYGVARATVDADSYGADAISSSVMGLENGRPGVAQPFSSLTGDTEDDWDVYKKTGKKVIPVVMTGFDPRPDPNRVGDPYWARATPQQIAQHLRDALKWSAANPDATAEANVILIYAWNQMSEGGWLLPSNPAFDPVGTGRLDAIADVLR